MATILENLLACTDEELLDCVGYIRNAEGERMNIVEIRHWLREERRRLKAHEQDHDHREFDQGPGDGDDGRGD